MELSAATTNYIAWWTVRGTGPYKVDKPFTTWAEGLILLYQLPRKAAEAIVCVDGVRRGYVLSVHTWKRVY